ncbi:hypothetical protein HT585_26795 [Ensifer sp. HO-A22]|uniref:Uncharacterized protein n=1 Tax=Ensifer oleiphilus TaxID=2742698 RepID=A0A7Y6QB97_9HYPH|nr:hypothetical protein [Ensifer oleiphilus]NVD42485.1 hypothetical protein [Ensifer oleiphilus]
MAFRAHGSRRELEVVTVNTCHDWVGGYDPGSAPLVPIRRGEIDLSIARAATTLRVSPVGLDGTLHLPVADGVGPVAFRLSNDAPVRSDDFFPSGF